MATYLQLVNNVLARLRETSVASVSTNAYSLLIGKFINDTKRQVEDAWNWDFLSTDLSINTSSGSSTLTVTGSGLRPRGIAVNNSTSKNTLINVPIQWIIDHQDLSSPVPTGVPCYYAWNGNDGTDSKVELYPTPNATLALKFHLYVPQADLSADGDTITVPSEPVIAGAYARALVERGEDGGLNSSEAYQLYRSILADYIAHEAGRFVEYDTWVAC